MPKFFVTLTAFLAASFLDACAPATVTTTAPAASDPCAAGTAVILVQDGFLTRGCGCNEGTGSVASGSAFACTVNSGTVVTFYFVRPRASHQVQFSSVPVGANAVSSQLVRAKDPTTAFGVTLSVAGAYVFADTFNSALSGTLTAL